MKDILNKRPDMREEGLQMGLVEFTGKPIRARALASRERTDNLQDLIIRKWGCQLRNLFCGELVRGCDARCLEGRGRSRAIIKCRVKGGGMLQHITRFRDSGPVRQSEL